MRNYTYHSCSQLLLVFFITILPVLISCSRVAPNAPERTLLDSTLQIPVSELSVPVYYPLADLEALANEKLNNKIIETRIPINDKNDSLYLSISRFRPIQLDYDGDRGITYSLPVQITGTVRYDVVGINVGNKTPIEAKIVITLFSDLYLNENWRIAPKTQLKNIEWVQEPRLNVAGIKLNLKPVLEKALENNQDKIIEKLDQSAGSMIKIDKVVSKLWRDMHKPIRINRKVIPVWLKANLLDMNGRILARSKDTLMIEVGLKAKLHNVFDSAAASGNVPPLPKFRRKEENNPGLKAHMLGIIPFDKVNQLLKQVTDTMKFEFSGNKVNIHKAEMYGTTNGIAIQIGLRGDLRANVFLRGGIAFDTVSQKLTLENFAFDIDSENSLISAADWLAHDVIINRLKPYLSIPTDSIFQKLPLLITKGIEKGKLGTKIDVRFDAFKVNIEQHLVTKDNIQIILLAKGRADVQLQKGLFDKKKKKPVS